MTSWKAAPRQATTLILAVMLGLSSLFAVAVGWNPVVAVAIAGCILAVTIARGVPQRIDQIFLYSLLALLAGYALFGRTFAGIGVFPVFIGELVLALGLLSAIGNGWPPSLLRTPSVCLLIAFMAWGATRTVPYLGVYGLSAIRDAVIWGYGSFALLFLSLIVRRDLLWRLPRLFGRLVPYILVVAPGWILLWMVFDLWGILGTAMSGPKPADPAPHLGGAAAFLLAGIPAGRAASRGHASVLAEWGIWLALLLGVVAIGSLTRGGLVAIIAAIGIVTMLRPFKAGKKLIMAGATALLVGTVWLGGQSDYVVPDRDRTIDPEQIVKNLMSIGGSSEYGLEDTRRWRLLWWNKILDYTVHGEYFWTGKGFGVNLTYDDGILRDPDTPNRNPHNGSLTILARAGVPGLVLWAALQLGFALSMLRGWLRARRFGQHAQASVFAWVLAYWAAILINATFDPSLEGPQGGIWFWCVFAYGVALTMGQARQAPQVAPRITAASYDRASVLSASGRA